MCVFRKSFTFKCHRIENDIYAVNDLDFHPSEESMLLTEGSGGTANTWNKDKRQKLKAYNRMEGHISCAVFNRDGIVFAYAVSYDWPKVNKKQNSREYLLKQKQKKKGYKFATDVNKIYIHDMELFEYKD